MMGGRTLGVRLLMLVSKWKIAIWTGCLVLRFVLLPMMYRLMKRKVGLMTMDWFDRVGSLFA